MKLYVSRVSDSKVTKQRKPCSMQLEDDSLHEIRHISHWANHEADVRCTKHVKTSKVQILVFKVF